MEQIIIYLLTQLVELIIWIRLDVDHFILLMLLVVVLLNFITIIKTKRTIIKYAIIVAEYEEKMLEDEDMDWIYFWEPEYSLIR